MNRYQQLLAATMEHVERLRERNVRSLPVDRGLLKALGKPPARPAPRPAAAPPSPGTERKDLPPGASPACRTPLPPRPEGDPAKSMEALRKEALACRRCHNLAASRANVVFGTGKADARLMFVGEAPGRDEDRLGEPFVGRAGELLTKALGAMGLSRDQVYIANVLKCRPDTPGRRFGNRRPTPGEMDTCRGWLLSQIAIVRPEAMVSLGAVALESLLGNASQKVSVNAMRGRFHEFAGIPLMPTFHPAFLLRKETTSMWLRMRRLFWEDLLMVMERLGMEITPRQRGYFQERPPRS